MPAPATPHFPRAVLTEIILHIIVIVFFVLGCLSEVGNCALCWTMVALLSVRVIVWCIGQLLPANTSTVCLLHSMLLYIACGVSVGCAYSSGPDDHTVSIGLRLLVCCGLPRGLMLAGHPWAVRYAQAAAALGSLAVACCIVLLPVSHQHVAEAMAMEMCVLVAGVLLAINTPPRKPAVLGQARAGAKRALPEYAHSEAGAETECCTITPGNCTPVPPATRSAITDAVARAVFELRKRFCGSPSALLALTTAARCAVAVLSEFDELGDSTRTYSMPDASFWDWLESDVYARRTTQSNQPSIASGGSSDQLEQYVNPVAGRLQPPPKHPGSAVSSNPAGDVCSPPFAFLTADQWAVALAASPGGARSPAPSPAAQGVDAASPAPVRRWGLASSDALQQTSRGDPSSGTVSVPRSFCSSQPRGLESILEYTHMEVTEDDSSACCSPVSCPCDLEVGCSGLCLVDTALATPRVPEPSQQLLACLTQASTWAFDSVAFGAVAAGLPLTRMVPRVLDNLGIHQALPIQRAALVQFCAHLDTHYSYDPKHSNAYHTALHAADVVQAAAYCLATPRCQHVFRPLDRLAVVLAAAVHDFRHPGVSNQFLVRTQDSLALRYNDRSVLENYHVAQAFATMCQPRLSWMQQLPPESQLSVRHAVISHVLATDMALSKRHLAAFTEAAVSLDDSDSSGPSHLAIGNMLLQCADVSHFARPLHIHLHWSAKVMEECFRQGALEVSLGLPVSPGCDRAGTNVPRSQLQFAERVIKPVLAPFSEWCNIPVWMSLLAQNQAHWKAQLTAAEQQHASGSPAQV